MSQQGGGRQPGQQGSVPLLGRVDWSAVGERIRTGVLYVPNWIDDHALRTNAGRAIANFIEPVAKIIPHGHEGIHSRKFRVAAVALAFYAAVVSAAFGVYRGVDAFVGRDDQERSPVVETIQTPTPTLEAVVAQTPPIPEATAAPTPYATAIATPTVAPQPTPYATATPTPTPAPVPTVAPPPTPIAGLEAIMKAQRFGISYALARDMLNNNPSAFYKAFGVLPAAQPQMAGWFDGNPANGEVVPRDNIAVMFDGVSGKLRIYLARGASATFEAPFKEARNYVVSHLTAHPERVREVSVS